MNFYEYAKGNPVSFEDPLGLNTSQTGLTLSGTLPIGISVSLFVGIATDYGGSGLYFGYGVGVGYGAGFSVTNDSYVSDAKYYTDLAGPFININGGGGWGPYGSAGGFVGPSDNGVVHGLGGSFGAGAGASGSLTYTNTTVIPIYGPPSTGGAAGAPLNGPGAGGLTGPPFNRSGTGGATGPPFKGPLTGRQCNNR